MNKRTDSTLLCFRLLLQQLESCKQKPLHVLRFDNAKTATFIIVCQSKKKRKGRFPVTVRELDIPIEEAVFFSSWLSKAFEKISINYFSSKLTIEENINAETPIDMLNLIFREVNEIRERREGNGTENQ